MDYDNKEKNPFFIPALIAVVVPFVSFIFGISLGGFVLLFVNPLVALILSASGLVFAAVYPQKRFAGCVLCLFVSLVEVLFVLCVPNYLSKAKTTPPDYTIAPHTRSSEQIAERESINEIINHTLKSNTERGT
ncbi:MAG: hypothetical protein K6F03_00375 [Saccharofermentans sp.]|nr:hypothetical protein [Saccharofermentans sp.]